MYAKIFESIYDGSLRKDWKALVVFQQLIVLADEKGYVDKTPEAISARTGIPLDFIAYGIAELEKADPDSRSQEEDGRRIVLINPPRKWGWRIVNHAYYRSITCKEDLRQYWSGQKKEYRQQKSADRYQRMRAALDALYKRRVTILWPNIDEHALLEISRRETAEDELKELILFKERAGQYFPSSISSLLQNWTHHLDRARNETRDQPSNGRQARKPITDEEYKNAWKRKPQPPQSS